MILGGTAYLLYAISTIIDKLFMKGDHRPLCTSAFKMFFDGLIILVIGIVAFDLNITSELIWWSLLLGLFYGLGSVSYMRAIKIKNVEEVVPVFQATKLLIIFIFGLLVFNEIATTLNFIGLVCIVAGIYLTLSKKGVHFPRFDEGYYQILLLIFFSVGYALLAKWILVEVQPIDLVITMYFSSALVLSIYMLMFKKHRCEFNFRSSKIIIGALFASIGTFLIYSALAIGDVSKVFSMSGLHSVFTFLLALIFLKEKFCWYKLAGTLTVFLGIYLVSI